MNKFTSSNKAVLVDDNDDQVSFVKCDTFLLFEYKEVAPRAKILYLVLKTFVYQHQKGANSYDEEIVWPGRQRLAQILDCSVKTVTNLLVILRNNELIVSEKCGVGQKWRHRLLPLKKREIY